MNEIINIATSKKLLNSNNSKVLKLINTDYKTDKIIDVLTVKITKLLLGIIKLERL